MRKVRLTAVHRSPITPLKTLSRRRESASPERVCSSVSIRMHCPRMPSNRHGNNHENGSSPFGDQLRPRLRRRAGRRSATAERADGGALPRAIPARSIGRSVPPSVSAALSIKRDRGGGGTAVAFRGSSDHDARSVAQDCRVRVRHHGPVDCGYMEAPADFVDGLWRRHR